MKVKKGHIDLSALIDDSLKAVREKNNPDTFESMLETNEEVIVIATMIETFALIGY